MIPRRALLAAPALIAAPARAQQSGAQPWPARPVQVLVGYAPGTGIDSVARFYADQLRARTGQPFVVVNRAGAYGNLAAAEAARAPADGTTLLITPNTPLTVNPLLIPNMPLDPQRDLLPVATLAQWGFVLLTNPEAMPVADIAALTARLRAEPGRHAYASGNLAGRAAAELYRLGAGFDATHVAYRSVPAALVDLIAGRVAFLFADVVAGLPQVRAGRLRALAVTTRERLPGLPEVPTLIEGGIANGEMVAWFAAMLPAGASPALQAAAHAQFDAVTRSPAAAEFLAARAADPLPGTPEQTAAAIRQDHGRWAELVRAARIEMD